MLRGLITTPDGVSGETGEGGRAPARGDPRRHGRANDPRHAARDATRDATRGARESDGASREHLRALFVVAGTWRHNHGERGISSWNRESEWIARIEIGARARR